MEQLFLNLSIDPTKFISYHVNSDMEVEGYYQKANEIALAILAHYKHVLGIYNKGIYAGMKIGNDSHHRI